jgi:hypothetical protein
MFWLPESDGGTTRWPAKEFSLSWVNMDKWFTETKIQKSNISPILVLLGLWHSGVETDSALALLRVRGDRT